MNLSSPKWEELNDEENAVMTKYYPGIAAGFIKAGEKKFIIPRPYIEHAEGFHNFKGRKDDTWVVTFPRSGTTLTQELVWILSNNFDYETAKKISLSERFPFFEYSIIGDSKALKNALDKDPENVRLQTHVHEVTTDYNAIAALPSPRFIKTHLGLELVPDALRSGSKIVYVARNPKDVVVSRYHFAKTNIMKYQGSFETCWEHFKNSTMMFSPYWAHIKEAWAQRNQPNFLFIFYEELVTDLPKTIRKIGDFLEKPYTEEQVAELAEHLAIDKFRANPMINPFANEANNSTNPCLFIRKGVIGDWKDHFTPELEAEANEWIRQNLEGTDLIFPG